MIIKTFDAYSRLSTMEISRITNFLYEHSGEFRDKKRAIRKSISYASKEISGLGGYVFVMEHQNNILGALVVNKIGMNEYLTENIFVYLAVSDSYRGKGIAKKLINYAINYCQGNISAFISLDDSVKELFEEAGFKPRNIEMRLQRSKETKEYLISNKHENFKS
jgi:GNAT superfamily N-acetyltransferase